MKPAENDSLYQWIANRTGLAVALLDRPSFAQYVRDRMAYWELAGEIEYINLLRRQPDELERLVELVAVPETWLFRYPRSFTFLAEHLRACRAAHVSRRLRLLSVACATGEEAYSLAITAAYAGWPLAQFTVDAIDCQRRAIVQARQSTFDLRSMRGDSPAWANPWLSIEGNQVRVDSAVARTVHFHCDDVLQMQPRNAPYDVIFCRNLLIYLSPAARQRLIRQLSDWLLPDALLFLGHAERSEYVTEFFERLDEPHAFAWKRRPAAKAVKRNSQGVVRESVAVKPTMPVDRTSSQSKPGGLVAAGGPTGSGRREPTQRSSEEAVASTATDPFDGTVAPGIVDNIAVWESALRLADSGDLTGALELAKRHALESRPNVAMYQLLGTLYAALQDYDEARDAFEKVVYLQPNHEDALLQLAMIYGRDGDQIKATRYRRRAARAHRNSQS